MKNIAVLASGEGTNLEAILEAGERGDIKNGRVVIVVSDRERAPALDRARRRGIKAVYIDPAGYSKRQDYDLCLVSIFKEESIDLVVLAGFMRLLSPSFIKAFPMKIMNIHPALLPAFSGTNGIEQAFEYGVKVTGCTVHFVDEGLDSGPVILQEAVPVIQYESINTLEDRIHAVEHRIYPVAIGLFCRDKLEVKGRRCYISDQ